MSTRSRALAAARQACAREVDAEELVSAIEGLIADMCPAYEEPQFEHETNAEAFEAETANLRARVAELEQQLRDLRSHADEMTRDRDGHADLAIRRMSKIAELERQRDEVERVLRQEQDRTNQALEDAVIARRVRQTLSAPEARVRELEAALVEAEQTTTAWLKALRTAEEQRDAAHRETEHQRRAYRSAETQCQAATARATELTARVNTLEACKDERAWLTRNEAARIARAEPITLDGGSVGLRESIARRLEGREPEPFVDRERRS